MRLSVWSPLNGYVQRFFGQAHPKLFEAAIIRETELLHFQNVNV